MGGKSLVTTITTVLENVLFNLQRILRQETAALFNDEAKNTVNNAKTGNKFILSSVLICPSLLQGV